MSKAKIIAVLVLVPSLTLAACAGAPPFTGSVSKITNTSLLNPAVVAPATGLSASPAASTGTQVSGTGLSDYQSTLESIYQSVSPSVVEINVVEGAASTASSSGSGRTSPFGNGSANPFGNGGANPFGNGNGSGSSGQAAQALGSGFIWDTQGHIVTNNHVVSGASSITVTFSNGASYDAKVVGADPNADLAVIQVSAPANLLIPVKLADTSTVKVGEIAIAIGNPFGLNLTMTQGIISGLQRSLPTGLDNPNAQAGPTYNIPDIIQTDAPINPGNSGGVLVDTSGSVIGVTAAIESNSNSSAGIGFVIPAEIVQKVVPSLISTGAYQHPYLGISGTDMTPDFAKAMGLDPNTRGALVENVSAGGPAANAGLQPSSQAATVSGQTANVGGDVITAIDGQPVQSFNDLGTYLFLHTTAGQTVTLTVIRGGKTTTVQVTTGVLPQQ